MTLLPDENIILESDTKEVVLTSHRILQSVNSFNSSERKSIMLEHITSCHAYRKSSLIALIVGSLAIILGLFLRGTTEMIILSIIAAAFFLYYFSSTKHEIRISSPSTTIVANVDKMSQKGVELFIDKVENAKNQRLLMLAK